MPAIDDFCDTIRAWMNWGEEEYPDALVTSFVRMGEERVNEELRIADQVTVDQATVTESRIAYPADYLETDFIRVVGGGPLRYKPRHDFYTPNDEGTYDNKGKFTVSGNYIIFGDDVSDGVDVELWYFNRVPVLANDETWLFTKYPRLYTFASLSSATAYGIEDGRIDLWSSSVDESIKKLNAAYLAARPSGSRLSVTSKRSFG